MNKEERSIYYRSVWEKRRKALLKLHGWTGKALGFGDLEECSIYRGFFFIPGSLGHYVVSRYGDLLDLRDGAIVSPRINHKGYPIWFTYIDGESLTVTIHRMVAITFIPIPEHHRNKRLSDLQVNHKDGNKENNDVSNLEWVTNSENMKHARENGMFSTEIAVLRKDVITNEVLRYPSKTAVSRALGVSLTGLKPYLNEPLVGRVVIGGFLYKLDDGEAWPTDKFELIGKEPFKNKCHMIGTHLDGRRALFMTLAAAADYLGVTRAILNNHRVRNPSPTPFMGWILTRCSSLTTEE